MSAPGRQRKDTAAAIGFMAFLALAAGGVGIVIAALAVGAERAWGNWRNSRGRGGGWDRHVEDQRAWLDADRARIDEWRAKRRDWWKAGADPAVEPERPALSSGRGALARRAWATVATFAERVRSAASAFRKGTLAGWRHARKVRAAGGTWWATVTARPDPGPPPPELDLADFDEPDGCGRPEPEPARRAPRPFAPQPDPISDPISDPGPLPRYRPGPIDQPEPKTSTGGAPVTTTTQSETNLDYTAADLAGIQRELAAIEEHNDALAARRQALLAKLSTASERVEATGGTTATAQALDAARAVADQLGRHLAGVADSTAEASDVTQAAHAGLAPARDAQDALQASGARGEFIDAAANG